MKTAVEWLWDELECLIPAECQEAYLKAKEMEKSQIIDAHYYGKGNGMDISHPLSRTKEISAEQYYNETYKSE